MVAAGGHLGRFDGRLVRGHRPDGWTIEVQFFKDHIPTNEGAIWVFGCTREPQGDLCVSMVQACAYDMDAAADRLADLYGGRSGYRPTSGYLCMERTG